MPQFYITQTKKGIINSFFSPNFRLEDFNGHLGVSRLGGSGATETGQLMTSTSGGDLVTVARPTLKRSQSLSSGEGVTVTTGGGEEGDRIYR